jgi:hypothetical protein
MRKSITINIPKPCHEDWNKMTPKDQGRHCLSCKKTVIDFSTKTDEQIIKTIESTGNLCGRFKTQQLNREIVLARKDKNNYLSLAASGLFAFLAFGNQDINAQDSPRAVQTNSVRNPNVKGKVATSILKPQKINGTILDVIGNTPLPGVNIVVKGTSRGVTSDFDGIFSIEAKMGETLVFSYLGYKSQEVKVGQVKIINIYFEYSDLDILGEVVVGVIPSYSRSCYGNETNEYESEKSKELRKKHQNWKNRNKARRLKWKNERLEKRQVLKNKEQERTTFGKLFFGIKSLFSKK